MGWSESDLAVLLGQGMFESMEAPQEEAVGAAGFQPAAAFTIEEEGVEGREFGGSADEVEGMRFEVKRQCCTTEVEALASGALIPQEKAS